MKYIQQGITLLEVLTAVAVLGIVAAISLPALGPMLEADRASNFIDEFSRTIKYARAKASSTDEFVIVCPIADPSSGGSCTTDWKNNAIVAFVDVLDGVDASGNPARDGKLVPSKDQTLRVMSLPNEKDKVTHLKGDGAIMIDGQGRISEEHQFVICPNGKNDHTSALQISISGNTWDLGSNVLTCSTV